MTDLLLKDMNEELLAIKLRNKRTDVLSVFVQVTLLSVLA